MTVEEEHRFRLGTPVRVVLQVLMGAGFLLVLGYQTLPFLWPRQGWAFPLEVVLVAGLVWTLVLRGEEVVVSPRGVTRRRSTGARLTVPAHRLSGAARTPDGTVVVGLVDGTSLTLTGSGTPGEQQRLADLLAELATDAPHPPPLPGAAPGSVPPGEPPVPPGWRRTASPDGAPVLVPGGVAGFRTALTARRGSVSYRRGRREVELLAVAVRRVDVRSRHRGGDLWLRVGEDVVELGPEGVRISGPEIRHRVVGVDASGRGHRLWQGRSEGTAALLGGWLWHVAGVRRVP